ncbi:MAG: lysophospholipid acyltransferase family protein [Hyphomicrobiaceae bacterium]
MDQVVTPPPESPVAPPPRRTSYGVRDIKHRLEFAIVWIAIKLFRALPMRVGVGFVAAVCGLVGPWLRQNRRALENLAIAFPDYDHARRRGIARAMWANMGRVFAETFYIDRLIADPSRIEITDEARWRSEMQAAASAVGATAHIGNWELAIWPMTKFGLAPAGVYRPLANPYLDRLLRQQRAPLYPSGLLGKGAETEAGSGHRTARLLVDHVRQNGAIGFVSDHYERRGVVVPFMGRFTRVTPVPAMIARHLGARVWMGRCLRIGTESRFRIDLTEIPLPDTSSRTADTKALTAAMFAVFEAWIRENPEQWMWWNTRWVNEADAKREG